LLSIVLVVETRVAACVPIGLSFRYSLKYYFKFCENNQSRVTAGLIVNLIGAVV